MSLTSDDCEYEKKKKLSGKRKEESEVRKYNEQRTGITIKKDRQIEDS